MRWRGMGSTERPPSHASREAAVLVCLELGTSVHTVVRVEDMSSPQARQTQRRRVLLSPGPETDPPLAARGKRDPLEPLMVATLAAR